MMGSGNITPDPADYAKAVEKPAIAEVRCLRTGSIRDAKSLIESLLYPRCIRFRERLRERVERDQPWIVCAVCGVQVYLVASPEKAFFFRHTIEDGSCPALTRSGLSDDDIRAMKYKGAQESVAHRRLKGLIERSLLADRRFKDVRVEATWRSTRDPATLRRPDVRATFNEQHLAFEAQLSTTFLDVVVGRKIFYRDEGALLVWILPAFDPSNRRLTVDDILFNNNSNVLIVDRETTAASEGAGRFMLRCVYQRPVLNGTKLDWRWESRVAAWDELQLDVTKQQVFLFDCEADESRQRLFAYMAGKDEAGQSVAEWADIQKRLAARGHVLADEHGPHPALRNLVRGLLSALAGAPVGYNFEKLVQVAHLLFDHCKPALLPFEHALRVAGHDGLLEAQDTKGRWRRKRGIIRSAIKQGDPAYRLDPPLAALVRFRFPAISAKKGGRAPYETSGYARIARDRAKRCSARPTPSGAFGDRRYQCTVKFCSPSRAAQPGRGNRQTSGSRAAGSYRPERALS